MFERFGFPDTRVGLAKYVHNQLDDTFELYAKVALHALTALKTSSKCSFIPYKLRFLVGFRLVITHNSTFA
uniref:Uncharacterized protein n=1 Tax=Candidatus Kentrum sp. DK TaxID=2126562 RepID=A0A450TLS0_9GAMM|nr:MAG: hypothetical protein BECKDK2373B_GA0170837_12197 [Candidatus Kentron sp. DK]